VSSEADGAYAREIRRKARRHLPDHQPLGKWSRQTVAVGAETDRGVAPRYEGQGRRLAEKRFFKYMKSKLAGFIKRQAMEPEIGL
jgi:hypothetical protein